MVKKVLFSLLFALFVSFLVSFGFFYLFSEGALTDFAFRAGIVIKQSNFWIAFGLWSLMFFLLFFLPFSLTLTKKENS